MGNQYQADYQRLNEFADTTANQIDLSISHTVEYDRAKKKTDRKLIGKGLEYQLILLHEKEKDDFRQNWSERLLLLRICFTAARTLSQSRKSWLSMTTYLN